MAAPKPTQRARRIFNLLSIYAHNAYDEQTLDPELMAVVAQARQELPGGHHLGGGSDVSHQPGCECDLCREQARLAMFAAVSRALDARSEGEAGEAVVDLAQGINFWLMSRFTGVGLEWVRSDR